MRFIDDGEDEQEEAALNGIKRGMEYFLSQEGQDEHEAFWKNKKPVETQDEKPKMDR